MRKLEVLLQIACFNTRMIIKDIIMLTVVPSAGLQYKSYIVEHRRHFAQFLTKFPRDLIQPQSPRINALLSCTVHPQ